MKKVFVCIASLANLSETSSFANMNSEMAKIRRERWLKSKCNDQDNRRSPALESQSWLEDLNSSNVAKVNDTSVTHETKNTNDRSLLKKSPGFKVECIDLTLSDDDNDDSNNDHSIIPTRKPLKRKISPNASLKEHSDEKPSSMTRKVVEPMQQFSVCSYNIWFGEPHPSERMARISELISGLEMRPTFIGLQEVTPALLHDLSPLLQSMGYEIISQDGVSYGCALGILTTKIPSFSAPSAKLLDSGFLPFSVTQMGRGLLWARVSVESVGEVLFSTTHLESFVRGNDGAREREMQIQEASKFCLRNMSKYRLKCCLVTGDLNWDDERKRNKINSGTDKKLLSIINNDEYESCNDGRNKWIDAWLQTRPGQEGYTYDSKENPMLKGNLRRRFDRCLYLASEEIGIHTTDLIGTQVITGFQWRKEVQKWSYGKPTGAISYDMRPLCPSDHFGLVALFGPATQCQASKQPPVHRSTKAIKRGKHGA